MNEVLCLRHDLEQLAIIEELMFAGLIVMIIQAIINLALIYKLYLY